MPLCNRAMRSPVPRAVHQAGGRIMARVGAPVRRALNCGPQKRLWVEALQARDLESLDNIGLDHVT